MWVTHVFPTISTIFLTEGHVDSTPESLPAEGGFAVADWRSVTRRAAADEFEMIRVWVNSHKIYDFGPCGIDERTKNFIRSFCQEMKIQLKPEAIQYKLPRVLQQVAAPTNAICCKKNQIAGVTLNISECGSCFGDESRVWLTSEWIGCCLLSVLTRRNQNVLCDLPPHPSLYRNILVCASQPPHPLQNHCRVLRLFSIWWQSSGVI